MYVIGKACFDECFLFNVIIWRHYFWYKLIVALRFFATAMLLRSVKQVFWKKSVFYVRHLHYNTKANTKVQTKAATI